MLYKTISNFRTLNCHQPTQNTRVHHFNLSTGIKCQTTNLRSPSNKINNLYIPPKIISTIDQYNLFQCQCLQNWREWGYHLKLQITHKQSQKLTFLDKSVYIQHLWQKHIWKWRILPTMDANTYKWLSITMNIEAWFVLEKQYESPFWRKLKILRWRHAVRAFSILTNLHFSIAKQH